MKEMVTKENTSLFDKGVSIGGIIIGISIITVIAIQNGFFVLAPIILGVLFMCVLLGYFLAKSSK